MSEHDMLMQSYYESSASRSVAPPMRLPLVPSSFTAEPLSPPSPPVIISTVKRREKATSTSPHNMRSVLIATLRGCSSDPVFTLILDLLENDNYIDVVEWRNCFEFKLFTNHFTREWNQANGGGCKPFYVLARELKAVEDSRVSGVQFFKRIKTGLYRFFPGSDSIPHLPDLNLLQPRNPVAVSLAGATRVSREFAHRDDRVTPYSTQRPTRYCAYPTERVPSFPSHGHTPALPPTIDSVYQSFSPYDVHSTYLPSDYSTYDALRTNSYASHANYLSYDVNAAQSGVDGSGAAMQFAPDRLFIAEPVFAGLTQPAYPTIPPAVDGFCVSYGHPSHMANRSQSEDPVRAFPAYPAFDECRRVPATPDCYPVPATPDECCAPATPEECAAAAASPLQPAQPPPSALSVLLSTFLSEEDPCSLGEHFSTSLPDLSPHELDSFFYST